MLERYGIKSTGKFTVPPFSIMKMSLFGQKKQDDTFWKLANEAHQLQWVNQPEILKPYTFAPSETPWAFVSAPYQWSTDVQKTVQIMHRLKKSSDPLLFLDLETTALDINSEFFHITEVAMLKSHGLSGSWNGPGEALLNVAVSPSKEKANILQNLIDRASAGQPLTKNERYAIASLMRYSGDDVIDPVTKAVKKHSELFSNDVLSKPFTQRQIEAMKAGLMNLQRNGIAETEIMERIKNFASDLKGGKATIVGHNIFNFDLPALQKLTNNKQRWANLVNSLNNPDVLDTFHLYRMYRSDYSKLHKSLIFNRLVRTKYAGEVITPSKAKKIAKEAREILKSLDLSKVGPYSLDSLRMVEGIISQGAHRGSVDITDLRNILAAEFDVLYSFLLKGTRGKRTFGPATHLMYSEVPMQKGQLFLVGRSQMGTGFDFTADRLPSGSNVIQRFTGYGLSRGVYEFQGFYQDTLEDGRTIYIAKFFDQNAARYSFLTGATPEELRKKIQQGNLQFLGDKVPDEFASYPLDVLEDYGRRRWERFSDIGQSKGYGWDQAKRFFDALEDPSFLQSTTELRDFEILRSKLETEKRIFDIFRKQVDIEDLNSVEKTYAFSLFDKYLSERYSQPDLPVTRSYPWQKSVYIFGKGPLASELEDPGTRVFLGESFVSQVDKAIQGRIKGTALEPQVERTKDILLEQMARNLDEAYGLEGRAIAASRMPIPYRERINKIRNILIESKNILDEVNLNRLVSRDLSSLRIEEAQMLAAEAINMAKTVSRSVNMKLFEGHPHQKRIADTINRLYEAYRQQGFGVGIVNLGGHVKMVLTPGDWSSLSAMYSSFKEQKLPKKAIVVDIPTLSELGNIIYGREHKISTRGFIREGKEISLYEDIVDSMVKKARTVKALADFETGDIEVAQRVLRETVRDRLELASGISRYGTYDRYEEAFRLDLRGNEMDLLRQRFINIREMAKEFTGEDWDDLGLYGIIDYVETFKERALTYYPHEKWARELTVTGIKDQASLLRGIYGTQDARDYFPLGHMTRSLRPNVVQWLNFYAYSANELQRKIAKKGIRNISLNPYIISRTGFESYGILSRGRDPLAKGISIGALEMSSEDIVYVLTSESGQRILKKYGLGVDEILATLPGTWEQGGVFSPEMRGLLDAIQPKDFEVSASTLDQFGDPVRKFLERAQKTVAPDGSILYTGSPIDIGLDDVLFTEKVKVRGEDVFVPTLFRESGGELGKISQITEYIRDGERYYKIGTKVHFPMDEATKFMADTRKFTASYFGFHSGELVRTTEGVMTKEVASSRAFHELFGENVHLLYLSKREKHLDIAADLTGRLRVVAEQLSKTKEGRHAFRHELTKSFGKTKIARLAGMGGYTFVIPDATELMERTTPEYTVAEVNRIINTLAEKFDLDLGDITIGDRVFRRSVVELRRSLVNEQKYIVDWLGEGIFQKHGVKITPREIASLKIKGAVMGVNMQPILDYLGAEAVSRPDYKELQEIASSMITAVGALTKPEELAKLPLYSVEDLLPVPALKDRSWYLKRELVDTIVGKDETFALALPKGFSLVLDDKTTISGALPVPKQLLKASDFSGKVYLDEQARALMRVQESIMIYNSFLEKDALHGLADSVTEADQMLRSAITSYVDALAKDISYSHGRLIEDVMSYRLPASGYVKAQNISARIVDDVAMTGEIRISRDLAIEMFGSSDVSPEVWKRLEGEGWYGLVRRDPNEAHWNFAVARYKIDDNMGPRTARLSAIDAALMGADFDGDLIALLSPYSKRIADMDPGEVARLQLALSKVHKKQVEYTSGVQDVIREVYEKESKKRVEGISKDYIEYLRSALTEQDSKYSLADFMWGSLHEEQAMLARIAKGSTGSLYNIAHMYREAGLAIYDTVADTKRIELLDFFTYITTESFALQSKHGGKETKTLKKLLKDLSRGTDLHSWTEEFAKAIPDHVAAVWSQGKQVARLLGAEKFIDLDETARTVYKTYMAQQTLDVISHVRRTAEMSGFSKYFDPDSVPARMFYSQRAYNKHYKHLGLMYDQFLNIRPGDEEFMKGFVPTVTWRAFAESTGQTKGFEEAEKFFRRNLRVAPVTRFEDLVEPVVREKLDDIARDVASRKTFSGLWRKIPSKAKWAAAGLGALYVLGRGLSAPPEPDEVPIEQFVSSPEALIALNNPDEQGMSGRKITVKAKNLKSINLDQIQEVVQQVSQGFGNKGNINIQQRDDTSTITTPWLQNLFARAIKNGRV